MRQWVHHHSSQSGTLHSATPTSEASKFYCPKFCGTVTHKPLRCKVKLPEPKIRPCSRLVPASLQGSDPSPPNAVTAANLKGFLPLWVGPWSRLPAPLRNSVSASDLKALALALHQPMTYVSLFWRVKFQRAPTVKTLAGKEGGRGRRNNQSSLPGKTCENMRGTHVSGAEVEFPPAPQKAPCDVTS